MYGFNERAVAHAERCGYVREGVKRRVYLKDGEWVDAVLFSLLEDELEGYGVRMEQLTKYLTDAHSIEMQALAQLRTAPDLADDPENAEALRHHLTETEEHERLVQLLRTLQRPTGTGAVQSIAS